MGAPNIHLGAPNIHLGAPNIRFCAPTIRRWEPNMQLGMWVSQQRRLKRDEKLSVERHDLLNELGFEWRGHRARHEREKHHRAQQVAK
eukprot:5712328-Pyramimonas_sp.AAC.1